MLNAKRALVTGGAGFIGAHLIREILASGDLDVVVLDDLSGGFLENVPSDPRVEFVQGSVTDSELVATLFETHQFKYVYHLAAYAAEGLSHFIRRFNYTNNVIGSINVVNESIRHEVDCFIFASSIAVYGAGQVPLRESMVPQPEDPYGVAKYAVELDLQAAQRTHGLNYVIFRPHNVYGEYQNIGDKYRNVVGIFMNQILKGEPMTIFGDGTQERAFSYVGDIVGPMAEAAWKPEAHGGVFNVGADVPYTVNELAGRVADAMGVSGHPTVHLAARNEVQVAYSDHSRMREAFGDHPSTNLDHGLSRMAAWVQKVGARESQEFGKIEVPNGMPESWSKERV